MTRIGLVTLLVGLVAAPAWAAPRKRPPNVIFVLADDLGYGDLGSYGQRRIKTPYLDRMAAEGTRFTQVYAGSTVCAPSRSVLMTGQHTGHTRIRGNARHPLEPGDVTVAEVLKARGYRTALVGKWGLGEAGSTGVPLRKGFDEFFGYLNQRHAHNTYPTFLWRNEEKVPLRNVVPDEDKDHAGVATKRVDFSHDLFTDEALAFVERNRERPFFLYLAYTIPHANNEGKDRGIEVPDLGIYKDEPWPENERAFAAMITRLDRDMGRLFERLAALGIDEQTIVFFSSDNGPHAEGGHDAQYFDSNGPLRGIKRDLYEGGIRVPMIVRWPGRVPAGRVSDAIWYGADFLPTAAALAGARPPRGIDGVNVLPVLLGQKKDLPERTLYWEFHERGFSQALRRGKWKLVRRGPGAPSELYDLSTDVGEERDLAARHPDVVARLEKLLKNARTESTLWPLTAQR